MLEMKDVIRRVSYPVVTFASTRPALYYGLRQVAGKMEHLCINTIKRRLAEDFARTLAGSARVSALLDEANTLHQRLIEIHERRR
ncbi:hypothetical protein [Thermostichus vulcanus]|uniref:Uncharacterized protein n=1 Tax=Thermostichus vulcanus str. 'Rupite' TaxID=2813851 RepID=A0ABT0CE08_THEVL|nr:hypothetical protein [Thermostichus vulcanus]MCJ2544006.1 hypothetical protein [Thermostichus vulcanus str. 'Rupite']